jgi:hypothetical protein
METFLIPMAYIGGLTSIIIFILFAMAFKHMVVELLTLPGGCPLLIIILIMIFWIIVMIVHVAG